MAKLEQELMTNNKIGVQRDNKSCQTNLTLHFSETAHLFDKVTSTDLQNSGKIRTSSWYKLVRKKMHLQPSKTTGNSMPVREGVTQSRGRIVLQIQSDTKDQCGSVCHPSWHGCDVLSQSCRIKSITEYGNGVCCQSSDGHKLWQQQKNKKNEEGNTLKTAN